MAYIMATNDKSARDRRARVTYMTSFLHEFRKIATQDGHDLLSYLLEMALAEARRAKEADSVEEPYPGADEIRANPPHLQ